jgi:hypothetical protein
LQINGTYTGYASSKLWSDEVVVVDMKYGLYSQDYAHPWNRLLLRGELVVKSLEIYAYVVVGLD